MAEKLVNQVPTYRLHFRPNQDLWPFLDEALGLDTMRNDE
jgi:hypothetical protein